MNLRDTLVRDSAVIHIVHCPLELIQAEVHASATRQQEMFGITNALLLCPARRLLAAISTGVRSLGEEQQPHGIKVRLSGRGRLGLAQLLETVRHTRLVRGHFARHEDEAVEHHAPTDDGYVLERLLEDNVDVPVKTRSVGVGNPPQV